MRLPEGSSTMHDAAVGTRVVLPDGRRGTIARLVDIDAVAHAFVTVRPAKPLHICLLAELEPDPAADAGPAWKVPLPS